MGGHDVVGAFDDGGVASVLDVPVLAPPLETDLRRHRVEGLAPAVGSAATRRDWFERLSHAFKFVAVVHPSASVSPTSQIGPGAFVGPGAVVHTLAVVGACSIINSGAIVEHDVRVGAFSHVAPGTVLCGGVQVGVGALVGAGSRAVPMVRIGDWATVGAGAVVLEDVPSGERWAGVPAQPLESSRPFNPEADSQRLKRRDR
jgi:sugar O-acyltransferase (sialic acid O-acetyltransferase NeuD family)